MGSISSLPAYCGLVGTILLFAPDAKAAYSSTNTHYSSKLYSALAIFTFAAWLIYALMEQLFIPIMTLIICILLTITTYITASYRKKNRPVPQARTIEVTSQMNEMA